MKGRSVRVGVRLDGEDRRDLSGDSAWCCARRGGRLRGVEVGGQAFRAWERGIREGDGRAKCA